MGKGREEEGKATGKAATMYESTTLGLVIKVLPIDF